LRCPKKQDQQLIRRLTESEFGKKQRRAEEEEESALNWTLFSWNQE